MSKLFTTLSCNHSFTMAFFGYKFKCILVSLLISMWGFLKVCWKVVTKCLLPICFRLNAKLTRHMLIRPLKEACQWWRTCSHVKLKSLRQNLRQMDCLLIFTIGSRYGLGSPGRGKASPQTIHGKNFTIFNLLFCRITLTCCSPGYYPKCNSLTSN